MKYQEHLQRLLNERAARLSRGFDANGNRVFFGYKQPTPDEIQRLEARARELANADSSQRETPNDPPPAPEPTPALETQRQSKSPNARGATVLPGELYSDESNIHTPQIDYSRV